MERWVVATKKDDFDAMSREFQIDPVIARIIRNRDVTGEENIRKYLRGDLSDLNDPKLLKGMDQALFILQRAITEKKKIRIIGDYDIDGVVSTYILEEALSYLQGQVDTYIPDRVLDGYGMHEHLVRRAREEGVEVILTCDNGISASREIALAKELGMEVIVTDHHDIPYQEKDGVMEYILPPADAVVNPKQADCPYPFSGLCGAGVAFKLIQALYRLYGVKENKQWDFLELVAMATVGDVMDLQDENRILVKYGLKQMEHPVNLGLRALIHASDLEDKRLSAYHIGFVLGPCINASGRLDTARRSLDLLRAGDSREAARIAGELVDLNTSRKALTRDGVEEAIQVVESTSAKENPVLVVFLPDCHESLAGIIAGRLRERYYKPAFVLTRGEGQIKGSGRSIEGYSMYDELVHCKDCLMEFGGHPMAAGLSLKEENISLFRERINEYCKLTEQDLMPKVTIDVPMPLSYISQSLLEEFPLLEPFGKGNPRPLFAQRGITIANIRIFGMNKNVVQMNIFHENGTLWKGIYFGDGEEFRQYVMGKDKVDIVYFPEFHEWQGTRSIRVHIQNYR